LLPPFPHANLGRLQLMHGRVAQAKRSFERALEYDPHYLPALLGLELIQRGGLQGL
jgi:Tfp pilus assembly protein PilF